LIHFQSHSFAATAPSSKQGTGNKPTPATPRLKRGEYLTLKATSPGNPTLEPRENPVATRKEPTYFEIVKVENQLILKFKAQQPDLRLSHNHPIVVDLVTDYPFQLNPTTILTEEWPKDSDQIPLKATGAKPGRLNRILGKAAYTYCDEKTKECNSVLTPIFYSYKL
jgi:hypothetical protein